MDIVLESRPYEIIKRLKKTAAKGWKDLKDGDIIVLFFEPKNNSSGNGRTYQQYIKVRAFRNRKELPSFYVSSSMIDHYTDMFEMLPVVLTGTP